ncbi:MAG TPA: helix-turn-helix transcriptional regulator [Longimicrobiaceae bacterium]|nr:helix-turn-helix transcriptional regulator [Longimicrobiaceae bacterium]
MANLDQLLGQVLADGRRRAGLTQEELASRAKLHPTYVSQLERGLKSPTVRVLFVVAEACGVPTSKVLRHVEELAAKPERKTVRRGEVDRGDT